MNKILLDKLKEFLKTMNVPAKRMEDIGWLNRNLFFQNANHPDFEEAWKIIGQLHKEQTSKFLDKQ